MAKKTDLVVCSCNQKFWKVQEKPSSKFSKPALVFQSNFSCVCIVGKKEYRNLLMSTAWCTEIPSYAFQ